MYSVEVRISISIANAFSSTNYCQQNEIFLADVLFQRDMKHKSFTFMTACMKLRTYCLLVLKLVCYGGSFRWEASCALVKYTAKF